MKVLKSSIIYIISTLIEKGMAFLLIPFYTAYLTTKDYGILSMLQSLISIFVVFFTLSLNGAASRFHFEGNEFYRKLHYGNIFLSITLITIFFTIILFFFKNIIFHFLGNIPIKPYFYLVIIIAYGNSIFSLYQLKLQIEQKAILYAFNNILKFLVAVITIIILVLFFHKKADGVLEGYAISFIIFIFIIIYRLKKEKIKFNLNKKLFKRNIKYSIYLIPHNIASILMSFLDRFFITNMISLSYTGIYTLGFQISSILGIITSAINTATVSPVLKAYKEKNYLYLSELTNISVLIISIIAMFLSLFSKDIIYLMSTSSYLISYKVVPFLTFYFVFQMYYFMTSSVLFYDTKATKFVPVATGLTLLFNFIFNYLFIKMFGFLGASIATLLSMIIVNYIVIFIANRYIKVGFEHKKIHFIIFFSFFMANINLLINLNIIFKCIIFIFTLLSLIYIERNNSLLIDVKRILYEKINKKMA